MSIIVCVQTDSQAQRMGKTIVGGFSKALLRGGYDRWTLAVQARKYAAAVALRVLEQRKVEGE